MAYTLSKITTVEEQSKVDEFLHEYFFPDMPIVTIFGLEKNPPPHSKPQKPAAESFTFKAESLGGEMVGVVVNRVQTSFSITSETPPEVKKMMEFLEFAEEEAELNKLPERTIELRILSVHPAWRGRGLARQLAEESMNEARSAGFKAMKITCVNEYTARLARSMGWREHYRLAYKDYTLLSGRDVYLKPFPPHEYLYIYYTDL